MADPSFFIGIVGNVISILVFASPIATFRRIVRSKSTEDFRWLPYVATLLSTSLWTFYGLLKPGGLLIVTVNGAGAALEAIYITLYLAYAPKETKAREDGEGGAGRERGRAGGGGGGGAGGAVRRRPAVRGRGAVRGAHHRHVRCADGRDEDGGEDEERGVHALLPLLLPLPQRRRLERLLLARQGLLHRNSECNRVRAGDGTAGAVHGVPEDEEEAGGERRRRRRRRRGGARGGAADGAGGDGAGDGAAEGAAAAQGAEPAQADGAAPRRPQPHHQVLLHHPRRAPLHPPPASPPPPLRHRPRRRRRRGGGGGGGRGARRRLRQPVQEIDI